jgi:hypothetical protein
MERRVNVITNYMAAFFSILYTKYLMCIHRSPNFKLLSSERIDSKESTPSAYVAWRAGKA